MCKFGFNKEMTAFEFIRAMEVQRCVSGSAYALKEYNNIGQVSGLIPLRSSYVTPFIDKESGDVYYRVDLPYGTVSIHNTNMFHVDFVSAEGLKGISPIEVLKDSTAYAKKIEVYNLKQMDIGLKPNLVIKVNGELTDANKKKYSSIIQQFKESGVLILDSGKELQDLKASSIIDTKLFDAEQITIKKVASVFNLPVSKLWGDTNNKATEETDLEYLKDTILPIVRLYEQALNRALLTEREQLDGYEIKLNMSGFARASMEARGNFYQQMIRCGAFCPNDICELEDIPPYEGGDKHYVSRDLIDVNLLEAYTLEDIEKGE